MRTRFAGWFAAGVLMAIFFPQIAVWEVAVAGICVGVIGPQVKGWWQK
jgi:hypothetical protein